MIKIENDFLIVKTKAEGAELTSIFNKKTHLEYLWQAGKEWAKHAPVLFPVVGQLKDNRYFYKEKSYLLERHGFARTRIFSISKSKKEKTEFILKDNSDTIINYPFHFELRIAYELLEKNLHIKYSVTNTDSKNSFFSIGAHPAFKIPLMENESYEDYFLEFNKTEFAERWKMQNGLIADEKEAVLNNSNILLLEKSLFYNDALVFKSLASDCISIKNKNSNHGLHFYFKGFPYFGIWAAKDADFVCLEPWQGIADSIHHNQQLENKEGIINLEPGKIFSCEYSIEAF
ncbi:MAG TPA: aldose 1-epimerase family protein [Bacteroidia bacterium]|nr:aldose 1-epimerase family protein [Bacteroidia bacterium]